MRSKITAAALTTVLVLGGVACGDDDGGDEASSQAAGDTTTTTEAGLGAEACDAVLGLGTALTNGPEGPPTPEYLEGELLPAIDAVLATDAQELTGPATELQTAAQAALDGEQVEEDEVFGLYGELAAATHTGCGYEQVDVSAVNYAFVDMPATLPAGTTSFSLTNDADEDHELVLFRLADGETRSAEELLALPQEEAEASVTFSGVTFASPGETGYVAAELEPGAYFVSCFLPVGGGEDGPPHFTEGMVAEFEVT